MMKNITSLLASSLNTIKYLLFLIIFIFSGIFSGCTSVDKTSPEDISENSTSSEKISVVTSFYPLEFFLSEIGGEKIEVKNLSGSVSPHSYQLTPRDIIALNSADLVVVQGGNFEPWSSDMIPQLLQKKIPVVEMMKIFSFEEEKNDDNSDEHDEHHHEGVDPHTWLDPILAQQMAHKITGHLQKIDSKNKDLYQKNLEKLSQKLETLDQRYTQNLKNCKKDEVIGSHQSFDYIGKRYNFSVHSIAGISPNDEPSAQTLGKLKTLAEEEDLHFLLAENNSVQKFSETLARETGVQMLPINPMGRGTFDREKDFFDIAEENLQSFFTALECQ